MHIMAWSHVNKQLIATRMRKGNGFYRNTIIPKRFVRGRTKSSTPSTSNKSALYKTSRNIYSTSTSNKCANKRCVEMLDLWSDAKCGFFGQTYFMRIMNKNLWDKPENEYSNENVKKMHDMFMKIVSYVCSADERIDDEIELITATEVLWSGGHIPLNIIQESVLNGAELDEEDAIKLARDLNNTLQCEEMKNYILYYSLIMAAGNTLTNVEVKRFEIIAEAMGVDAGEILQIFVMEKRLMEKMESLFGVNKR